MNEVRLQAISLAVDRAFFVLSQVAVACLNNSGEVRLWGTENGKITCLIPAIFGIFKRGKVLAGAYQSRTTQAQMKYAIPIALVLAAVGYFVPAVADDAAALVLLDLLYPFARRILQYTEKKIPAPEVPLEEMLVLVRKEHESVWHEYGMCINDARVEGWKWGVDFSERVIDLDTLTYTGETRPYIDDKERAAGNEQVKDFVAAVKKARGDIEVCADNTDKEQ